MGKRRNKKKERKIAEKRIEELFKQADEIYSQDKDLANRYVELARKLAMKYKVRLPSDLKKKFCKHCYSYLMPGDNCRVRTRDGKVTYTCLECKNYMRFPMKKEQKAKRQKTKKDN